MRCTPGQVHTLIPIRLKFENSLDWGPGQDQCHNKSRNPLNRLPFHRFAHPAF